MLRPPMVRVTLKLSRSALIRPSSTALVPRSLAISPVTLPSSVISSSALISRVPRGV